MEAFVGTILMWPLSWAPDGWALCQGQSLQIMQNQALYSLIGITYGGDGKTTFNLPNLQGRFPVGVGQIGAQSTLYQLGKPIGSEQSTVTVNSTGNATLTSSNLPGHTHTFVGTQSNGTVNVSGSADLSKVTSSVPATIDTNGGGQSNTPGSTLVLGPAKLATAAASPCNIYCNPSTVSASNIKVLSNPVSGTASVTASGTASITPAGTVASNNASTTVALPVSVTGNGNYSTVSPCLPINFIICLVGLYPTHYN